MQRYTLVLVALISSAAFSNWKIPDNALMTRWGRQVTPETVWRQYPRPQMVRSQWHNLNGLWDYAIVDKSSALPTAWQGKILVPFSLESVLSGVKGKLGQEEALWYRLFFSHTKSSGMRILLHFEAVDYETTVWVNGAEVGSHIGGHVPFSFDITQAVRNGDNELLVRVIDSTSDRFQLKGKQTLNPQGIWYTAVSGIWQTVWLETVPLRYIRDLRIETDIHPAQIRVQPMLQGQTVKDESLRVIVRDQGRIVSECQGRGTLVLPVENAKLWSPDSPFLYDLEILLLDENENVIDRVVSYAGIRTVGKRRDAQGNLRLILNDEIFFHWGTLDQGWWPDGLLTPPSDEAMVYDIQFLKDAGFNMIRKHVTVENRRYYYYCDRLGMLVWQDHVATREPSPEWKRLRNAEQPEDAEWPDEEHRQWLDELKSMVDALYNYPSIVVWVPFNERWGQHRTMEVGQWLKEYDKTRLLNIASGGNFHPVGDIADEHRYPHPMFPLNDSRYADYVKAVGEFGGHGLVVTGHIWDPDREGWGYGGAASGREELKQRYEESIRRLGRLKRQGVAAGVYTQTTDVEIEVNGLLTYDRAVQKLDAKTLRQIHHSLQADDNENRREIAELFDRHETAVTIKDGWIRDPYIYLAPDGYYYLTGTTPLPEDPRQLADPYNSGLGETSIVGYKMAVWRSADLIDWESLGTPYSLEDGIWKQARPVRFEHVPPEQWRLWAPEIYFRDGRWIIVHTSPSPVQGANLSVTQGPELKGPFDNPLGTAIGRRHDPSLFFDDDGAIYLLWGNTMIAPLSSDLKAFIGDPVRIDPAGSRSGPDGRPISRIGHEGTTMRKIDGLYVLFGTAWSTDQGRKGTYNLYYCTAEKITGPYGPRRFVGRFLGHGTPFQDKQGRWWCTAFFNANVPPLSRQEIKTKDVSDNAYTINPQGVTIVPLEVKMDDDGTLYIRAKDPDYAAAGPEEVQRFSF